MPLPHQEITIVLRAVHCAHYGLHNLIHDRSGKPSVAPKGPGEHLVLPVQAVQEQRHIHPPDRMVPYKKNLLPRLRQVLPPQQHRGQKHPRQIHERIKEQRAGRLPRQHLPIRRALLQGYNRGGVAPDQLVEPALGVEQGDVGEGQHIPPRHGPPGHLGRHTRQCHQPQAPQGTRWRHIQIRLVEQGPGQHLQHLRLQPEKIAEG
mmetsp:Transcript_9398/g.20514  ORF Transcript_9398/g.20514 Transcript_9398/m.20514 type:complete len:205 (-) Transcript_9398:222-836(-)